MSNVWLASVSGVLVGVASAMVEGRVIGANQAPKLQHTVLRRLKGIVHIIRDKDFNKTLVRNLKRLENMH